MRRRRARLRWIGIVVLVLGLASAAAVYWIGSRSPDPAEDPSLVGYSRPQLRNMELLYGKMGGAIEDLSNDLKRPGTQAALIGGASVFVAAACFYLAGPHGEEAETPDGR